MRHRNAQQFHVQSIGKLVVLFCSSWSSRLITSSSLSRCDWKISLHELTQLAALRQSVESSRGRRGQLTDRADVRAREGEGGESDDANIGTRQDGKLPALSLWQAPPFS